MAGVTVGQANFSKGVISSELHGRIDVAAYASALRMGENIVVLKYGGFRNRQGTRFICELPGDARLLPFEYSTEQAYALAFSQGEMQPFAFGGYLREEELRITAVSNADPAIVTIRYHGYATGDRFVAAGVTGMTEINDRIFTITVLDGDRFSIDADATGWGAFTGSGGGTLRTATPPPSPPPPVVPDPVEPPDPPPSGGNDGYYFERDYPDLVQI